MGNMSDDNDTDVTEAASATTEDRPPQGERKYTGKDVEAIVKKRLGEQKEQRARLEELESKVAYQRSAAAAGVPIDMMDPLFHAYRSQPSDERDAWLESVAKRLSAPAQKAPEPKPQPQPQIEKAPVQSDKGAPLAAPRDLDSVSNPNEWTRADIDRLYALHGVDKGREMLRERVSKWLSGVRLKVT